MRLVTIVSVSQPEARHHASRPSCCSASSITLLVFDMMGDCLVLMRVPVRYRRHWCGQASGESDDERNETLESGAHDCHHSPMLASGGVLCLSGRVFESTQL
jgi:hypothetical protein